MHVCMFLMQAAFPQALSRYWHAIPYDAAGSGGIGLVTVELD